MKHRIVIRLATIGMEAIDPPILSRTTAYLFDNEELDPEFLELMHMGGPWSHRFGISKASRWIEVNTDSDDVAVMLTLRYEKPHPCVSILWPSSEIKSALINAWSRKQQ